MSSFVPFPPGTVRGPYLCGPYKDYSQKLASVQYLVQTVNGWFPFIRPHGKEAKCSEEAHKFANKILKNYNIMNEIPDGATIKVHGFVMLKGLDDGKTYKVKRDEKKKIYWFCGPRSGRKLIGHYFDNVNGSLQCFIRGDNNGIEVIKKKEISVSEESPSTTNPNEQIK